MNSLRTYGTLALARKREYWELHAEPHVIMRAKRVFPKCDNRTPGQILLSNSPENCCDLDWFLDRYALVIDTAAQKYLRRQCRKYNEVILTAQRIMAGEVGMESFALAVPPRQYQLQAARLALTNRALLLADDVGLGKTASAICVLTDPSTRPALVVTLAHLTRQWQAELAKFAPAMTSHILQKGTPYELKEKCRLPDVIISTYHKLFGWSDALSQKIKAVVFDECQELRCDDSAKYAGALRVTEKASLRLGLSATPIYNYGGEMFNVIQVLDRHVLGTRAEFLREWCGSHEHVRDPKAFGSYLREKTIFLRRTRAEVQREIPPITQIPHTIDADAAPLENVQGDAEALARRILAAREEDRGDAWQAAGQFDMLVRQATGIAKAPYVAEFVRLLVASGEYVVLFGWHRDVYNIWMEKLKDLNPVLYTGSESAAQKEASKKAFVDGESKVLIISLRAGAGLDGLQHLCRTCVIGELDWSPGVHEQCIGRIARDGQKDPVSAYFLIAESGSDPVIADVLGLKTQQIQGIRDPKLELIEKIQNTGDHVKRLAQHYLARKAGVA